MTYEFEWEKRKRENWRFFLKWISSTFYLKFIFFPLQLLAIVFLSSFLLIRYATNSFYQIIALEWASSFSSHSPSLSCPIIFFSLLLLTSPFNRKRKINFNRKEKRKVFFVCAPPFALLGKLKEKKEREKNSKSVSRQLRRRRRLKPRFFLMCCRENSPWRILLLLLLFRWKTFSPLFNLKNWFGS